MRKILLIIFILNISLFATSQETTKQKEIGLAFRNIDNFGITFKTGTNKSVWRFTTLIISGYDNEQIEDSIVYNLNNIGFDFAFGREYRKIITENFELRIGADITIGYDYKKNKNNDKTVTDNDALLERTMYETGINIVFGFNYVFNDNFIIGAELSPNFKCFTGKSVSKSIYTNDGNEVKSDYSGINYGLSNASVLISLAYRF